MALSPQNDEAFLREVDEELRREQLGTFWRRYGKLVIALIILGLAIFGGFLFWQAQREKAVGLDSEKMSSALQDLGTGKTAKAEAALKDLSAGKNTGYRDLARLALAARKMEAGDTAGAISAYSAIQNDTSSDQALRDLALIRGTAAVFDTLKPETVINRMKPLAVPGNPWFGSAGEMTAVSWLKLNRPDKAGAIFGALVKDPKVPESIRARATRIAGALGVDVARLPVAGKE